MNNLENKLIIIYGKAGTYKSSVAKQFLKGANSCYINLEQDKDTNIDTVYSAIKNNDVVVVDYIELLGLTIDNIIELKKSIVGTNKTLVLVSCCASDKELFNNNYNKLKEVADLMGISQSYISRLEKRIIEKLKKDIERVS